MTNLVKCLVVVFAVAINLAGCSKNETQKPVSTTTNESPTAQPPPPVAATPVEEPPPEIVASKPAEILPPSTYNSNPPYPVELYVKSPDDAQPGWLKILGLSKENETATAKGQFPEQNKFVVDTQNVERIQIHIGHLPLAEKKRITLHIDKQPYEIVRDNREYVTLLRRSTGQWEVEKPPKE